MAHLVSHAGVSIPGEQHRCPSTQRLCAAPDDTLLKVLARAHRWKRMLEAGRERSLNELILVTVLNCTPSVRQVVSSRCGGACGADGHSGPEPRGWHGDDDPAAHGTDPIDDGAAPNSRFRDCRELAKPLMGVWCVVPLGFTALGWLAIV